MNSTDIKLNSSLNHRNNKNRKGFLNIKIIADFYSELFSSRYCKNKSYLKEISDLYLNT